MSGQRRESGGYCDPNKLPRGPNGRALCRLCAEEVPTSRRTFCGHACVHSWKLKTDPSYQREHVWIKDLGACRLCQHDLKKTVKRFQKVARVLTSEAPSKTASYETWPLGPRIPAIETMTQERDRIRSYKSNYARRKRVVAIWTCWTGRSAEWTVMKFKLSQAWDMDHEVPLIEGGTNDMTNLRVLCRPCHKRVTKELAGRRAANRKEAKRLSQIDQP